MGVGTAHMKVNAITMEVPILAVCHWIVERTYLHRIGHGCYSEWCERDKGGVVFALLLVYVYLYIVAASS